VHEQGNTSTIIGTEYSTVRIPLTRSLPDLVRAILTMHSINVRYEQRAVSGIDTSVNVQVTCLVIAIPLMQVLRYVCFKPCGEHCYAPSVVWPLD
jgi:hypothetical protein